jgi:hypothetical protein
MTDPPIVCALGSDALKARKQGLLARVSGLSHNTLKIDGGYRLEFTPGGETLSLIAQMIDAERQCCRFLRFDLTVEPDCGLISLQLTGPSGTQEFLSTLLEPA